MNGCCHAHMVHEVCFIEDFLLPALNTKQFENLLEWTDEDNHIFRVLWSHKSGRSWKEKYFRVFLEWDTLKGRTNRDEPGFLTESKGRFRSALNRLKQKVTKLQSKTKGYRYYKLQASVGNSRNEHLAQQRLSSGSCSPCSPSCSIESDNSEDQNCNSDEEAAITIAVLNEQVSTEEEMYDAYVPDSDNYSLDFINEDVQYNEVQRTTDDTSSLLSELKDEEYLALGIADVDFHTIDVADLLELLDPQCTA